MVSLFCRKSLLLLTTTNRVLLSNLFFSSQPPTYTNKKSDIVVSIFKNHGFSHTQISKLITQRPHILSFKPHKTLLPKLHFFQSIGVSTPQLTRIISRNPIILSTSLNNQLIPCYSFLKNILILDQHVVKVLTRNSRILLHRVENTIAPNLSALTEAGVPQSSISFMLFRFSSVACHNHDKVKRCLEDVLKMGFNPLRCIFVQAVQVVVEMSRQTWDCKMEVYRRWGLSDDEIMIAFRSHPWCMNISEEKIMRGMDFLVNQMGWEAIKIARYPGVLFFNLEKRIIPRCRVIKALMSEGLAKKDFSLSYIFTPVEKKFLERFVTKYEDSVPGLKNVYLGKKGFEPEMK